LFEPLLDPPLCKRGGLQWRGLVFGFGKVLDGFLAGGLQVTEIMPNDRYIGIKDCLKIFTFPYHSSINLDRGWK